MKTKTRKELFAEIEELRTRLEVSEEMLRTLQGGDKATLKEIAHLKKANETLTQLASFPEINPNPVVEVDLTGYVSYFNSAAKQLFPDLQMTGIQHPWLAGLESLSEMLERERKSSHVREVKIGETWYEQTIYYIWDGKRLRTYGLDITARKQAEEALHESEKDLNRAQAVAHTGSWRLDIRRNELLWSDETHHIFGIPKGTPLTYEAFLATVHPEDRQIVDQSWQAALRGEPYDIEHRILVEGNIKWVRERAELEFDKGGSFQGGFGTVQDITERKQVEEKLKYSERKYRKLYEGSQDGFVLVDMEGHIKEFNHAYMEMLGYSEEELMRLTYIDLTPQKWHAMEAKIVEEQVLSKGYSTVYEKEYIKKDGTIFPISLRTYLIKETNGNPKGMWAFVRDITKRKEMEETLRRSRDELEIRVQERTSELAEQSKILEGFFTSTITPLVFLDRDFNFIRVNEAYAKACQREISEFPGHNHFEFYPSDAKEIFEQVVETKTPYQATARPFSFPDHPEWGTTYWNWTLTPLLDEMGEVEFLVFSLEDVTERKRAEEQFKAALLYARSLIEASLDPLVTISREGKIMDVNSSTELITGVPREQLIGSDFLDYFMEPKKAREGYQQVFETGSVRDYPLAIRHTSGMITDVLYNATIYRNEAGEIQGVFAAARDITERKRAEDALKESENRLRHLSSQLLTVQENERKRIARELHDGIGQILTAVKFKVESTIQEMEKGKGRPKKEPLEDIIPMIKESIEEVRRIQMDLRPSTLDDLGILATLEWFCREYQKIYSHIHIEKESDLQESEVSIPLKTAIYRVMQEAMNNIAKHSKADLVKLSLGKQENKIQLIIQDNGQGFDLEEILSPDRSRRGMGLNSMRERTELSGGSFLVESTRGRGTVIRALWPTG